jgi:predicted Zn-dependent peptidase
MSTISLRTLGCGMPLIVEPMPGVGSVGITWLLPAGSATDPDDRQGLSAMWSEILFRGAGEMDSRALADALDRVGATRSTDVATYHLRFSCTVLGSRLDDALPLLVDMVRRPRMDESAVDPTRDLCLQELASLADDPQERAILAARERHNPPPLNRSGLGTEEGLRAITRTDLVEGWARQVRPSAAPWGGAVLAIAGAVADPDAVAAHLDRLLTGWEGAPPPVTVGEPTGRGTYHHEQDDSAQVQVVVVHDAPPEPHPDANLERVVSAVLSGGMAARLFSEVREKRGLCYSVSSSYAADRAYGRVLAYVGTTPERAQTSLEVLMAELDRINTPEGAVRPDEFERAMTGIKSNIVFSGESTAARAAALAGDYHRLGRPRSLAEIRAAFDAITLDDVNAYLSRRQLGPVTIVTLGPAALTPPAR